MALLNDGVTEKGYLAYDSESDTMYFNGNHINGVLGNFVEKDIEITIKKLPKPIGKCPRLIELCYLRDKNNNCTNDKLCVPCTE